MEFKQINYPQLTRRKGYSGFKFSLFCDLLAAIQNFVTSDMQAAL